MKKITCVLAAAAALMLSGDLYGQGFGLIFQQNELTPTDLARLSYYSNPYGTARSTAMGNAFTSIGADLSSMHLNPAGLGMYRGSDFAMTPMLTVGKLSSTDPNGMGNGRNRKTRFAPANIGAAFNLYQGGGALTSFTFGFGYNRLADFNTTNRMYFSGRNSMLGDVLLRQIDGESFATIESLPYHNFEYYHRWGALLAYDAGLIEKNRNGIDGLYDIYAVGNPADIYPEAYIRSRGRLDEYNISAGFNFQNKIYFGFSLGIQEYYLKQTFFYDEYYENNPSDDPATAMLYDMYSRTRGAGVNFKAGLIYRPVDPLRIGLAVHTPTYFSNVCNEYSAGMRMEFADNTHIQAQPTPTDEYDYDFSTPARLMAGASYTFLDKGIVSVDYERTWYNSMRYRMDDDYQTRTYFNSQIKSSFTATNTIRVGGEIRPLPQDISFRAGFTYTGSMVDIDLSEDVYDSPVPKQTLSGSAGLGFRIGRYSYLDLAYVFSNTKYTDYYMYHYAAAPGEVYEGGNPTQKLNRHTVLASLGFRF